MRLTHIGGPTVLIQAAGWRLLTDPTFDPPGRKYNFGWGTGSVKVAGPALAAAELESIDAVLLTHDHHDDNLDPSGRALLESAGSVVTTLSALSGSAVIRVGSSRGPRHALRLRVDSQSRLPPPRAATAHRSAVRSLAK